MRLPLARYSGPKLGLVRTIDGVQLNAASSSITDVVDMYCPRLTVHVPPDDLRERLAPSCEDGDMGNNYPRKFVKHVKQANCAHFVLNSTSLQLIPAHSSLSLIFL